MTYPQIGNTGVNKEDVESARPWVSGFVIKESSPIVSNFRSSTSLDAYLKQHRIAAIEGIDTRMLVRRLRIRGAMKGILSHVDFDAKRLQKKIDRYPGLVGVDLVREVTCRKAYDHVPAPFRGWEGCPPPVWPEARYRVTVLDLGVKTNILRELVQAGCRVRVVPASTPADMILADRPDGVLLSNGPGDPGPLTYVIKTVRALLGKVPIFGICMGHHMLGLALGGKTYKMKFGHRGGNQPVMHLPTRRVEITSHNHGFAVDPASLPEGEVEITHVNLNDQCVEGLRHRRFPAFCVQYHPEASPGPHDAGYLFRQFTDLMAGKKEGLRA
jgi:carbamoyl-phosphate synthase small subunit